MTWPLSQDYNEAIQNPASSLGEPVLRRGSAVVNELGLPIPRSGSFADVYEFRDGDGRTWALKCFTRQVSGLRERYAAVDRHLRGLKLPFAVGFRYLAEGIRIRGQWYPILQMEWVEGFTLNEFLCHQASNRANLEALFLMWVRLSRRLRQADVAHGDLQHGNVLLVPAGRATTLGLKLIDYDGMWVPELARRPPGEAGHPAFQHPTRRDGVYGPDVDRFPHLVIACALRALILGGADLWKRFDNGDNLLFREDDLVHPASSTLVRTLWKMDDPLLTPLLGHLILAAQAPLPDTPWLDYLMASAETLALQPHQQRTLRDLLGVDAEALPAALPVEAEPVPASARQVFAALRVPDEPVASPVRSALSLYWLIPLGALALGLLLLVVPILLILNDRRAGAPAMAPPGIQGQAAPEPEIEALDTMPRDWQPSLIVLTPAWSVPGRAAPRCLDFSRDGRRLVAAAGDSPFVTTYETGDGRAAEPARATVGPIRALCAAGPDQVVLIGEENVTALWELADSRLIRNLLTPDGPVRPLSVSPSGRYALGVSVDGRHVERYLLQNGLRDGDWKRAFQRSIIALGHSPDGARWLAIDDAGTVDVFDIDSGRQTTISDLAPGTRSAGLGRVGRRMLTFGDERELTLWDLRARRLEHTLSGHPGGVNDAVMTPDERWIISVGGDRMLRVWSAEAGHEVQHLELPESASCVRLAPDGRTVATASTGGERAALQLWRIAAEPVQGE